jgi:sugar lactone lactonase YvrE
MRKSLLIWIIVCACINVRAQTIITTIGGNGMGVYGGNEHDGEPATNAQIIWPDGICLDKFGNIYIAESGDNRVRKIAASTGIITTIGGTGAHGFSGDGGPATDAQFLAPEAVVADTGGNVYIADAGNSRIRKITLSTGIVTTIVGSGSTGLTGGGDSGDGGLATNAEINGPSGICLDNLGNIYIADYGNNKIRKVNAATGIITTFAGKEGPVGYTGGFVGYSGDGGLAINAVFSGVAWVFADGTGNIFIPDQWNHALRRVDATTGIITTIAGTGSPGYSGDGGPATEAKLNQPTGVFVDKKGNIFVAEYGNGTIRKIDGSTSVITTVAGTGTLGFSGDGGSATKAELRCAEVFLDDYGHVFIADADNDRIREVFDSVTVSVPLLPSAPKIEVYPNPATDELNVTGIEQHTTFRLQNITGVCVLQGAFKISKNTLPMRNLMPGIYILEMVGMDGSRNIVRVIKDQ